MTTRREIHRWLKEGIDGKKTHVIVVCDSFSHEDYPVYVGPDEDVRKIAANYDGKDMQTIMEVYNLSLPIDDQMKQPRVLNY